MSYVLVSDSPYWVESDWVYDEEKEELVDTDREITDIVDDHISYYWIYSDDRDEVLKVMDFVQGEEIVKRLENGELDDLEHAETEYEYAEVRDERPPQ